VEPRFISYTAKTSDDQEAFGIITSESGGSITLRGLDGKEQTISRTNLKSLISTNHSLMPMGFESAMSSQEMADLIAYLQRN
jgi:putative heme-binding domain-containing protein